MSIILPVFVEMMKLLSEVANKTDEHLESPAYLDVLVLVGRKKWPVTKLRRYCAEEVKGKTRMSYKSQKWWLDMARMQLINIFCGVQQSGKV